MAKFLWRVLGLAGAAGIAPAALLAAGTELVQLHSPDALWFENASDLSNAEMTVVAPDGSVETVYAASGTPVYRLNRDRVVDGVYRFELTAATGEEMKILNPIDNGRGDAARDSVKVPMQMTGYFVVSRNVIITPEDIKEE